MTKVEINNYRKALVEVKSVIDSLNYDEYKKIPQNLIDKINENIDKEYIYEYNKDVDYENWNLMPETKALLYNILKRYLLTEEQKQYFKAKEKIEKRQIEKEKKQKYNPDDIFKNKEKIIEKDIVNSEKTRMVVRKKEKWHKKIFNIIKKILKKLNISKV